MEARHRTALATELEKRSFVRVLRSHPEWSLRRLLVFLRDSDPELAALGDLTIGEVIAQPDARQLRLSPDEGPMIDLERLDQAQRVRGQMFDQLVLEVLVEASPRAVGAPYLIARVGGPRWKLQASMRRLVEAGRATRTGATSDTRYCTSPHESPGGR